jgi:predicted HicB family RNase H-like nuclease
MMDYKGYTAKVEFDAEVNLFHGEVINLRDVVTFQGSSVRQLNKAFRDSVEDYLEYCASRGEEPDKPYSGKFMVRVEPELHKSAATQARLEDKSLNAWVHDTLAEAVK